LPDPDQVRVEVDVLPAGTAVAFVGAMFIVWHFNFVGEGLANRWVEQVPFMLILACPLAFYYAIIRHRAFDIHVIIRQGLQYALARGAVLGVVPLLAAILVLDLALNSRQPLIEILERRGWVYVGVSGLALICYWQRKSWLAALDRRFFRER
jgi:phosphoserine phosphatase RsbU/P